VSRLETSILTLCARIAFASNSIVTRLALAARPIAVAIPAAGGERP
jgi:hypothetical protein